MKMAGVFSIQSQPVLLSPPAYRTRAAASSSSSSSSCLLCSNRLVFHHRSKLAFLNHKLPVLRGSVGVVRFSMKSPMPSPLPDGIDGMIQELFGRAEGLLYTLADAAVSSASGSISGEKDGGDWLSGITNLMESVLKVLKDGLSALHVPYAYGFAIILLTVLVKAATFPLTKKQVESAMAMRSLQPQVKAIQQRYAGDQERIQLETARLYKLAGVNPLAGCLPTLATIPVWIGLYRALSNVANEGLLTEGFFWIPSLAGPTTIAAKQNGSGFSWLFPFVDGHPPLGWSDTFAYLMLPVLLVVSQYISVQIMQSSQVNDPNMNNSQAITKFLPLMIGYFALSVPSGLSLYWLTNNILSTAQQVWFQKLGGAKDPVKQLTEDIIRAEKQKLQESAANVNLKKVEESSKEDKSTAGGQLRPGERFKQIKEQEAKRRQQREEEKRKGAAQGNGMINEGQKTEIKPHKTDDVITDAGSIESGNQGAWSVTHVQASTEATSANQTKKPESNVRLAGDDTVGGMDEQHSFENLDKFQADADAVDTSTPGENTQREKLEQLTQRDED